MNPLLAVDAAPGTVETIVAVLSTVVAVAMTIAFLHMRGDRDSYKGNYLDMCSMASKHEKEYRQAESVRIRLLSAIARHRKQTGQNLCWENDLELWQALDEPVDIRQYNRPPCDEFMGKCLEYWKSRKPEAK